MNLYEIFQQHPIITTDSRNCPQDSSFFALKGERFNANEFAALALENGCAYAIIDEEEYALDDRYILVEDVLKSLQDLAKEHRQKLGLRIIGITGSNGKTTTKELTAAVLKEKYNIHYTQGNLNNHIGVPLTLLQLKPEHQLGIIEMGANHIGEIAELCAIAQPDFGIITNVGLAHLEGFNDFEGVKQAKSELYQHIAKKGLGIFINKDNKELKKMAEDAQIAEDQQIEYSLKNFHDTSIVSGKINSDAVFVGMQCYTGETFSVQSHLVGDYNAENILAAVSIGHFFGLTNTQIKQGIENYEPTNNRSQLIETEMNKLVVDAYNANPASMQAAISNFINMQSEKKMVVLGDMLELGDNSIKEHQNIVNILKDNSFEDVYLVGKEFEKTDNDYKCFSDTEALSSYLSENKVNKYNILIKGSRGIRLEKIISIL